MKTPDWIPAKNPKVVVGEIYLKDSSFESPNAPQILKGINKAWDPNIEPSYHISVTTIREDWYEVVLCLSVETTLGEDIAYVVEVHQAGLFSFRQFDEDNINKMLGSYCPRFLFPFAREAVVGLVQKGGFRQLSLPPIEFSADFSPPRKDADSNEDTLE